MHRSGQQLHGRTMLDDPAGAQHHQPITGPPGQREIVGDVQHGQAVRGRQVGERVDDAGS